MRRLIARRLAQSVVIVLLVAAATFLLLHLAPGDPLSSTLDNPRVSEAHRERLRAAYGLDRPAPEQFALYLRNVAVGDLGYAFSQERPVRDALAAAIPNTLLLMSAALIAAFALGMTMGLVQAVHQGSWADRLSSGISLFFYSMPDFWLALMAMLMFAYWIPIFPSSGMCDPVMCPYWGFWRRAADIAIHMVLPVTVLTLLLAAGVARFQRAATLDVTRLDYVRTARAKGLSNRRVVLRHVLRNTLIPAITLLALSVPLLLGGAVFIESVFGWPGMGLLTVKAIQARDYPLITGTVILGSALVCLANLGADILYAVVDPRVRAR